MFLQVKLLLYFEGKLLVFKWMLLCFTIMTFLFLIDKYLKKVKHEGSHMLVVRIEHEGGMKTKGFYISQYQLTLWDIEDPCYLSTFVLK